MSNHENPADRSEQKGYETVFGAWRGWDASVTRDQAVDAARMMEKSGWSLSGEPRYKDGKLVEISLNIPGRDKALVAHLNNFSALNLLLNTDYDTAVAVIGYFFPGRLTEVLAKRKESREAGEAVHQAGRREREGVKQPETIHEQKAASETRGNAIDSVEDITSMVESVAAGQNQVDVKIGEQVSRNQSFDEATRIISEAFGKRLAQEPAETFSLDMDEGGVGSIIAHFPSGFTREIGLIQPSKPVEEPTPLQRAEQWGPQLTFDANNHTITYENYKGLGGSQRFDVDKLDTWTELWRQLKGYLNGVIRDDEGLKQYILSNEQVYGFAIGVGVDPVRAGLQEGEKQATKEAPPAESIPAASEEISAEEPTPEQDHFYEGLEYYEDYDFRVFRKALFDLGVDYLDIGTADRPLIIKVSDAEPYLEARLQEIYNQGVPSEFQDAYEEKAPILERAAVVKQGDRYNISIYIVQNHPDETKGWQQITHPLEIRSASYGEWRDYSRETKKAADELRTLTQLEESESNQIRAKLKEANKDLSHDETTETMVSVLAQQRENRPLSDEAKKLADERMEAIFELVISEKMELETHRKERFQSDPVDALMSAYRLVLEDIMDGRSRLATGPFLALWGYPEDLAKRLGSKATGPNRRIPEMLSAYISQTQQSILERVTRAHAKKIGIDSAKVTLTTDLDRELGKQVATRFNLKSRRAMITRREIAPDVGQAVAEIKKLTETDYSSGEIRVREETKRLNSLLKDLETITDFAELAEKRDGAEEDLDFVIGELFSYAKKRRLSFTFKRGNDDVTINVGDMEDVDALFNPDEKQVPDKYLSDYLDALISKLQVQLEADRSARETMRVPRFMIGGPSIEQLTTLLSYFDKDSGLNIYDIQDVLIQTFEADVSIDQISSTVAKLEEMDDSQRVDFYEQLKIEASERREQQLMQLLEKVRALIDPIKAVLRKNGMSFREVEKLTEDDIIELLKEEVGIALEALAHIQETRDGINHQLAEGIDGERGVRPGATWEKEPSLPHAEKLERGKREDLVAILNNRQRRERWISEGKNKRKKKFGGKPTIGLGDRAVGGLFGKRA